MSDTEPILSPPDIKETKEAKGAAVKEMQKILAGKRMAQQQAQVDEVVGIMRTNVEKVLERDTKLSSLDSRAKELEIGASQFEQQAGKLKQKFWIENYRWIIVIILLVIGIIILGLYGHQDSQDNHDQDAAKNASLVSAPEVVLDTKETQTMKNPEMKEAAQVLAKPDTPKSI